MSWDSKAAVASRRRQNSTSSRTSALPTSTLTLQQKPGTATVQPKSTHVSDPFLQDFLQPGFDPAAYWNRTLGTKAGAGTGAGTGAGAGAASRLAAAATSATATADRAAQAQATVSQLGAHTSRLTSVLTQLTDDILRSGSRLAYEVELLRGETIGLGEIVVQHQAALEAMSNGDEEDKAEADPTKDKRESEEDTAASPSPPTPSKSSALAEPPSLAQLRMLAQVRSRLDAVIRTFGDAMEFVVPPSALSVTASFLSVSGPDQDGGSGESRRHNTTANSSASMEDKGQQVLRARREEIAKLLESATITNDNAAAAAARVDALRTLCRVWTGTAEEKARVRFVDSLQRMVDDRQKELDRDRERLEREQKQKERREQVAAGPGGNASANSNSANSGSSSTSTQAASTLQGSQQDGSSASGTASRGYAAAGYGFISQLQKIRSGL